MAQTKNLDTLIAAVGKLPQQKIAHGMVTILIVYIALVFAKMTWRIVPDASINSSHIIITNSTVKTDSTNDTINVSKLNALNLFGIYNKEAVTEQPTEIIKDAPQTRLNLTLTGLTASDDPQMSAAIIEYNSKQETYGIGEMITGTRATLEQVLADRVLIRVSGQMETLMMDGGDFNQPAKAITESTSKIPQRETVRSRNVNKQSNVVDQRFNKSLSASAKKLRTDLSNDPGKITDYLRISPKRQDGKIIGYSLRPGSQPEFFKLSGLRTGDVAVNMNGYDLIQPAEAAQAMSALQNVQNISLLVNRKGELIEILFSID
ncbi:MAG: type II secretion system protein GspC [Colwellia sp.]